MLMTIMLSAPRGPPSVASWRAAWFQLIEDGKLCSTSSVDERRVRYGLCFEEGEVREFCTDEQGVSLQLRASHVQVGPYDATLRANRALRPAAAPKLGELPEHDELICSFCTGPLRLAARPMVAQSLVAQTGRCWDVHFNISPMEPLGHFLLVPEIELPENRRPQRLTLADCVDLVHIGRACNGELCINYNSPLAGASQNHLHAHAWAIPTPYSLCAARAEASVALPGGVDAAILAWPASVLRLRGAAAEEVGAAVDALCSLEPVHNVAIVGDDTFVFVRSAEGEVSPSVPDLKIGTIQLLGRFVVDSAEQLEAAAMPGAIESAMRDTRATTPLPELLTLLAERLQARAP